MQPLRFLVVMERDCSVYRGRKTITPPEPIAALNEKCFVTCDKPHDNRFIMPEPISSRTRRKLQLRKCDGSLVTSDAEVYKEMEPSSEDEENVEDATCFRSHTKSVVSKEKTAQRIGSCATNGNRSRTIVDAIMPSSGDRATLQWHFLSVLVMENIFDSCVKSLQ